jgi:2-phospho-L-lactate guanylyltransferase
VSGTVTDLFLLKQRVRNELIGAREPFRSTRGRPMMRCFAAPAAQPCTAVVASVPRYGERPVDRTQHADVAVLVPVKAFAAAKLRLAPALADPEREALARAMADRVVSAAGSLPVAIVCDDDGVARWAQQRGARVLWQPGLGLNGAVRAGVRQLRVDRVARAIVAHADLPLAADLASVADAEGVVIVPDRRDDGSNVLCVPTAVAFRFSYGPGSFSRHCAEARRLGLSLEVRRDPRLAYDVDVPADLAGLGGVAGLTGVARPR